MGIKTFNWKSIPADAQIRILDDEPMSFIQWRNLYTVPIPSLDVDLILDHHDPDYIGAGPCVSLKPEVKEWCIQNLEGNMAHPRVTKEIDQNAMATLYRYHVEFLVELDAVHFKLRWIG